MPCAIRTRPPSASATTAAMPAAEHQRASRVSGGTGTRIVSWMVWRVAERMAQRPFDLEESGAHAAGVGESCVRAWEEPSGGLAPSPPPRGDDGEVEVVTVRAGRQASGGVYGSPTESDSRDRAEFRT